MNIPTAHSIDSLERFMDHIQSSPIPRRVTVSYLKKSGFKTGNDPELRHISRLLGFISDKDVPLKRWKSYRTDGRNVLRESVEECYRDLFNKFPDAFSRSDNELRTWFRPPITSDSKTSVIRAIRTFRKLCILARIPVGNKVGDGESMSATISGSTPQAQSNGPEYIKADERIPFVLQLPPSRDKSEYKQIFEAFKDVFYS